MAANVQRARFAGPAHRVVECVAVGHQGGCAQNPLAVSGDDTPVHVRSKSEVVGIDDQSLAENQKIASLMRRNFLGLARMSLASDWNSRMAPFMASYICGFTSN